MKRKIFEALALVLIFWTGCKSEEAPPDAGITKVSIEDEELGFSMDLTTDWILAPLDKTKTPSVLGDARRLPIKGRPYLVAPRLVVAADPTDEKDAAAVIRAAEIDLRAFGEKRGVAVNRMAMSTRRAGSFEVGDVELAYAVKSGDSAREVVQRSIMTRLPKKEGTAFALTVTVTYMAEDADLVMPEIQRILASLRITEDPKNAE
jgi:hypothetical protein